VAVDSLEAHLTRLPLVDSLEAHLTRLALVDSVVVQLTRPARVDSKNVELKSFEEVMVDLLATMKSLMQMISELS
jgi:hypothetical protein